MKTKKKELKYIFTSVSKSVIDEKSMTIKGVIGSDVSVDRQGESINPMGWKLDNFKNNPVVLYGHDYHSKPIAKATRVWVEDGKLLFDLEFANSEDGKEVFDLMAKGFLSAFSVGFQILEWDETGEFTFKSCELYELSVVPVPANPRALKGADTDTLSRVKSLNVKYKVFSKKFYKLSQKELEMIISKTVEVTIEKRAELKKAKALADKKALDEKKALDDKKKAIIKSKKVKKFVNTFEKTLKKFTSLTQQ